MWVRSLGGEDPPEEEMQSTSAFLPGESHGQRGAWQTPVHRVAKSWTRLKRLSTHILTIALHDRNYY